jgi:hypothetical protein
MQMTVQKIMPCLWFDTIVKAYKVTPKEAAASAVVVPEAPIVMGRSVSLHHKTKLHHVKVKPFDSNENSISADGPQ